MTIQSIGTAIKARRVELGLSQNDLAARVNAQGLRPFRQSDVSRLERELIDLPRPPRLRAIAAALELPIQELLARAGWLDEASCAAPPATLLEAIRALAQAEWECGYAAGRDGLIGAAERERRDKWWARVRALLGAAADDADR